MRTTVICILIVLLSSACSHGSDLFREALPSETGVTWVHENGHSAARYLPETAGPGVAIFDYNNDGLMDILLVNSGTSSFYHPSTPLKHALYRNNGNGTFTDVSKQAGIVADLYARASRSAITITTASTISSFPVSESVFCITTTATEPSLTSRPRAESLRPSGEPAPCGSTMTMTAGLISSSASLLTTPICAAAP